MDEKSGGQASQPYVLAFAFLIGAALLSATIFFSLGSVSSSVGSLASTLAAKSFAVPSAQAPSQPAAAPSAPAPSAPQPAKAADIDIKGRPSIGPSGAPVTIVEFSDFQCPFCQRAYPTVKQILGNYGDKVKFVYMNFPLPSLHPYAQKAAEAAECANDQGKFWEYHDTLFTTKALDIPSLKQHAADLGIDAKKFNACLDSGEKASAVSAQQKMGSSLGVSGTPTFFINGQKLVGAQPYSAFQSAIDAALAG